MRHSEVGGSLPAQPTPSMRCHAAPEVSGRRLPLAGGDCPSQRAGRDRAGAAQPALPLAGYAGIAARLVDFEGNGEGIELVLVHDDPALSRVLHAAPDTSDIIAHWRRLSQELGLPMLLPGTDGKLAPVCPMLGRVVLGEVASRRRRRIGLARRRPGAYRRRPVFAAMGAQPVHRGEAEIIARH